MVARIPTNSEAEEFSKLVSLDTIKVNEERTRGIGRIYRKKIIRTTAPLNQGGKKPVLRKLQNTEEKN